MPQIKISNSGVEIDHNFSPEEVMAMQIVARMTAVETLTTLGLDMSQPIEVQADFAFLRRSRTFTREAKRKSVIALLTTCATGLVGAAIVGAKAALNF